MTFYANLGVALLKILGLRSEQVPSSGPFHNTEDMTPASGFLASLIQMLVSVSTRIFLILKC